MNNGSTKRTPNTNSYGRGYKKITGIAIEFGAPDATMLMTVTLVGPAPTPLPTLAPMPRPTPHPTIAPTLRPTLRPTITPTSRPTLHPTIAPTLRPTLMPTSRPTLRPMPMPIQQLLRMFPMVPTPQPFTYVTSPTPWPVNYITPKPQQLPKTESGTIPGSTLPFSCSNFNGKKQACKHVRKNCRWHRETKACPSK